MSKYTKFRYMFPPRPVLFTKSMLNTFNSDWIGQLKLNGTRTLAVIFPDGKVEFWDRHKKLQKAYKPTDKMIQSLLSIKKGPGFYVFDGELLHSKSKLVKDTLILMDIFVENSEILTGTDYQSRYKKLEKFNLGEKASGNYGWQLTENLWLYENIQPKNFQEVFESRTKEELVEGLVVKQIKRKLGYIFSNDACDWMGKIRKPSNNYRQ